MGRMKLQIIGGRLGADAEAKTINGREYVSFRMAVDKSGGDHPESVWISCLKSTGAKGAEGLLRVLRKGTKVYVDGAPDWKIYNGRNGAALDVFIMVDVLEIEQYADRMAPDVAEKAAQLENASEAIAAEVRRHFPATAQEATTVAAPMNDNPDEDLPF